MYYDDKERVVQTRSSNHLGGYDIVYNAYNFTSKQLKTYKTHGINGATDTYKELYTYSYDNAQRLLTTTHQLNGGSTVTLVSNSYDELGRVHTKNTGNIDATTYTYNIRSWITDIIGSHFTENLYYNSNTANLPAFTPAYNGNIAGMQWSIPSESLGYNRAYTFGYDGLNRLTAADYCGFNGSAVSGTTGRYNERFAFDKMGNITNFVRYGLQANNSTMIYAKVDDLVLDHTGNQLRRVTDSGINGVFYGDEEFVKNTINSGNSCAYDANGNRLYDSNSNIWGIRYNTLNLPDAMQFYQGHQTNYTYDASGMKLKVVDKTAPDGAELPVTSLNTILTNPSVAMITTTDYVGNIIYENGTLKRILTSAGYWQDGTYYYFLKDHLGSNRVVITGSGGIAETSSYYPSGMRFGESAVILNNSIQPYRHTGHEMQEMHGLNWYDNLARFRTVSDGSGFTGVDPLAEKYYSISPYAYCLGNPIRLVDIDGRDPGDFFNTMDAAAKDFGNVYNDNSIRSGREYGSIIYMIADSKGNGGYTYGIPVISEKGNTVNIDAAPAGLLVTGMTHTHGNYSFGKWEDNLFSGSWDKEGNINTSQENKAVVNSPEMSSDIGTANKDKLTLYVATSSGSLQKYDPATGKISVISTKMPSDPQDPNKLNKNDANVEKKPVVIPKSPELFTPAPARIPYRIVN